jgi:hypothetical protein
MRMKSYILIVLSSFVFLLQPVCNAAGLSYSVKGFFSYEMHHEMQDPNVKRTPLNEHFELHYDDCRWKVTVVLDGTTNRDIYIYQYDGTNLTYYVEIFGTALTNAQGMVEASPVPYMWDRAAGWIPWLAFASECYFGQVTNGYAISLMPAISKKGQDKRYEVPVDFNLSPSLPHFPVLVRYTTDKFVALEDDGITFKIFPLSVAFGPSSPFNDGYMSAEFKSDGFTNVNGLSFPTTFEYRSYRPKRDAKTTNDLDSSLIIRGEATEITVEQEELDTRLPAMRSYIADLRFPEAGVLYRITNGIVPSTNSTEAIRARKQAVLMRHNREVIEKEKARRATVARRKKIIWAGVSITILTIASVVYFVRKRTINTRSQAGDKLG